MGKIIAASYSQWRKVKNADRNKFQLIIDSEYKLFDLDGFVYDHNGEQLFWFNHADPALIKKAEPSIERAIELFSINPEYIEGEEWRLNGSYGYDTKGFDVDGVPVLTHYTLEYCARFTDITQFEPLTVGVVVKWFGWFLYQLENSNLTINPPPPETIGETDL